MRLRTVPIVLLPAGARWTRRERWKYRLYRWFMPEGPPDWLVAVLGPLHLPRIDLRPPRSLMDYLTKPAPEATKS